MSKSNATAPRPVAVVGPLYRGGIPLAGGQVEIEATVVNEVSVTQSLSSAAGAAAQQMRMSPDLAREMGGALMLAADACPGGDGRQDAERVGIGGGWVVVKPASDAADGAVELEFEQDGRKETFVLEGPLAAQVVASAIVRASARGKGAN